MITNTHSSALKCLMALSIIISTGCSSGSKVDTDSSPKFTSHPENQNVKSGSKVILSALVDGNPMPTLKWEESKDGGATWSQIENSNSTEYSFIATYNNSGDKIRASASNVRGNAVSGISTITVVPNIVVGGYYHDELGNKKPGMWVNGSWSSLEYPYGDMASVPSLGPIIFNGTDVIVPALLRPITNDPGVIAAFGCWINGKWSHLPSSPLGIPNAPPGIAIIANRQYITTSFETAGRIDRAYLYRDNSWSALASPAVGSSQCGIPVAIGNDVYISGRIDKGYERYIPGYWKNNNWVGLPYLSYYGGGTTRIAGRSNSLYVAGFCLDDNNQRVPGYWKNGLWVSLPRPSGSLGAIAVDFAWDGDTLHVVGSCNYYSHETPSSRPCYWVNGVLMPLPLPHPKAIALPNRIFVQNGIVHIGAISAAPRDVSAAGYWTNGEWFSLPRVSPYHYSDFLLIY